MFNYITAFDECKHQSQKNSRPLSHPGIYLDVTAREFVSLLAKKMILNRQKVFIVQILADMLFINYNILDSL